MQRFGWNLFGLLLIGFLGVDPLWGNFASSENFLAIEYLVHNPVHLRDGDSLVEMLSEFAENCPNHQKLAKTVERRYYRCIQSRSKTKAIINAAFEIDKEISKNKHVLSEAAKSICELAAWTHSCLNVVANLNLTSQCAPDATNAIEVSGNVLHYLCGNNRSGKNLSLLISDPTNQCFGMYASEIQDCLNMDKRIGTSLNVKLKGCGNLIRMHECTHQAVMKCKDSRTAELVNSLNQVIQESYGCTILGASMSSASCAHGSFVFVVIMIFVFFM